MPLAIADSLRLAAAANAEDKICDAAWRAVQLAAAMDFLHNRSRGPDADAD